MYLVRTVVWLFGLLLEKSLKRGEPPFFSPKISKSRTKLNTISRLIRYSLLDCSNPHSPRKNIFIRPPVTSRLDAYSASLQAKLQSSNQSRSSDPVSNTCKKVETTLLLVSSTTGRGTAVPGGGDFVHWRHFFLCHLPNTFGTHQFFVGLKPPWHHLPHQTPRMPYTIATVARVHLPHPSTFLTIFVPDVVAHLTHLFTLGRPIYQGLHQSFLPPIVPRIHPIQGGSIPFHHVQNTKKRWGFSMCSP